MVVRRFVNSDLPVVVRLWNSHHQELGLSFPVSPHQFQAAVLDRMSFDPQRCWIAEAGEQAVGYVHCAVLPRGETRILSLCVDASVTDSTSVANKLIQQAVATGATGAGLISRDRAGYVGLSPLAGLVGVPEADIKLNGWLQAAGFSPGETYESWQLSLATFRLPIDRRLIALRRSSQLHEVDRISGSAEHEAGWGHLDPLQYELRERTGKVLARITAWHAGYGEVMPGAELVLTDLTVPASGCDGADMYLVAEALRDLATRRFLLAKVVVSKAVPSEAAFWQSLGFRSMGAGAVYNRVSTA